MHFSEGYCMRKARRFALSGRMQCHFKLAAMATLFSISASVLPIFSGCLCLARIYFGCHILCLAVFIGRLYGNRAKKTAHRNGMEDKKHTHTCAACFLVFCSVSVHCFVFSKIMNQLACLYTLVWK